MPNTQTGRSVTAEVNGPCPCTRETFVADVIATAGPFAFIASERTNRPGSAPVSAVRLSTEICDTILPASLIVTLRGKAWFAELGLDPDGWSLVERGASGLLSSRA